MPRRPAFTVIYISHLRLVRADFSNGPAPELVDLIDQPRPDVDDAALLLEVALSQGRRPGKRVWVLAAELWSHTVRLGATGLTLKGDELAQALAFEAEPLSGISGLDSLVAFQHLGTHAGEREFRVVQARTADVEAMRDATAKAGSVLAGVAHPAGLPRPIRGSGAAWERLEIWPDAVVLIGKENGGPPRLQWIGGDPQQGRWRNLVAEAAATGIREVLVSRAEQATLAGTLAGTEASLRLDEESGLREWLGAWAAHLARLHSAKTHPAGAESDAPVLRPPRRPMGNETRGLIAAALGLVVGCLCFAHYTHTQGSIRDAEAHIAAVTARIDQAEGLQKQAKERAAQAEKMNRENQDLARSIHALATQRQRYSAFLAHFAARKSDDVVIRTIECEGAPIIRGWCMEAKQASDLARDMAPLAAEQGWHVQYPTTKAMHALGNGGPWEFEVRLRDTLVVDPAPSVKTASPARPAQALPAQPTLKEGG
jgi:hypothetical protein